MDNSHNRAFRPVKEEHLNHNETFSPSGSAATLPPPQRSFGNASVKPQPQRVLDLPLSDFPPVPSDNPDPSDVLAEVHRLGSLSTSIHIFKRRFDELQNHLDFIDKAIEARSKELAQTPPTSSTTATMPASGPSTEIINAQSKTQVNAELVFKEDQNLNSNDGNSKEKPETSGGDVGGYIDDDELKSLCGSMSGRGLRKYLVSHKSNTAKLREQVSVALTIAPSPAKLVLECVGRFYLQGSRAFTYQKSPLIAGRDAAILVLECFLLSGCAEQAVALEVSVRDEANTAAIAWRSRLVSEGGVSKAGDIDAKGLLMLVASFGIPAAFKDEDLADLVRLGNAREVSHVLRKSHVFRGRIPDIIEGMMKKGLAFEAVDISYTFGYEEKFSPSTMLSSFLQKSEEAWRKARQDTNASFHVLKEANEKHLAALKSVLKCLENHKIDWKELLPGCLIKEKIDNLTRDIADSKRKMEEKALLKRKVDKIESSSKMDSWETTRSNCIGSSIVSPSVAGLRGHGTAAYEAGRRSRDVSVATNMYEAGYSSHLNNYPGALSAELVTGVPAGIRFLTAVSNPRYNEDIAMDNVMMDHNPSSFRWCAAGEVVSGNDRPAGQSLVGQHASARAHELYGQLPSLKGFAGLPDAPSADRSASSDLYSFADAVVEVQPVKRYDPSWGGHFPTYAPSHNPSYS